MDTGKIFTVLYGFLLVIALALTVTSLFLLGKAAEERHPAKEVLECTATPTVPPSASTGEEDASPSDAAEEETEAVVFFVQSKNGTLCVYSHDGYLLYTRDVQESLLPEKTRSELRAGIRLESAQALAELLAELEE